MWALWLATTTCHLREGGEADECAIYVSMVSGVRHCTLVSARRLHWDAFMGHVKTQMTNHHAKPKDRVAPGPRAPPPASVNMFIYSILSCRIYSYLLELRFGLCSSFLPNVACWRMAITHKPHRHTPPVITTIRCT